MSLLDDPFSKKPDFVNDLGTKWWLDKELTKYALRPNENDIKLDNVNVFYVETKEGRQTRLLIEDGEIIKESTNLENMAVYIDFLKANKGFKTKKK